MAEVRRLSDIEGKPWNLPISWSVDGEIITGTLTLACAANLNNLSIGQAKQSIAALMKQAILFCARQETADGE